MTRKDWRFIGQTIHDKLLDIFTINKIKLKLKNIKLLKKIYDSYQNFKISSQLKSKLAAPKLGFI